MYVALCFAHTCMRQRLKWALPMTLRPASFVVVRSFVVNFKDYSSYTVFIWYWSNVAYTIKIKFIYSVGLIAHWFCLLYIYNLLTWRINEGDSHITHTYNIYIYIYMRYNTNHHNTMYTIQYNIYIIIQSNPQKLVARGWLGEPPTYSVQPTLIKLYKGTSI